jgi:transposase, IS5 family
VGLESPPNSPSTSYLDLKKSARVAVPHITVPDRNDGSTLLLERIKPSVFPTAGTAPPSLRESVPPAAMRRLRDELARVDASLDDPAFFAPLCILRPRIDQPSTPMGTCLRLTFARSPYRLGCESLRRESPSTTFTGSSTAPSAGNCSTCTRDSRAPQPLADLSCRPHSPYRQPPATRPPSLAQVGDVLPMPCPIDADDDSLRQRHTRNVRARATEDAIPRHHLDDTPRPEGRGAVRSHHHAVSSGGIGLNAPYEASAARGRTTRPCERLKPVSEILPALIRHDTDDPTGVRRSGDVHTCRGQHA